MTNLEFHKKEINDKFSETYENMGTILEEIYQKYTGQLELDVKFVDLIDWLCEEHSILNKEEKEYLRNVVRPFRNRVMYIVKRNYYNCEYLIMRIDSELMCEEHGSYEHAELPSFKKDTMYKGMEVDKKYTLEELGL